MPSTGTSYLNHSSSGPTRTERTSTQRFRPFSPAFRARGNEHRNAEAGPSTLVPPQVLPVGPPTSQPTGGTIPETTTDANATEINTEEEKIPVSHFYRSHIPHVTDRSRDIRCPNGPGFPKARENPARAVRWHRVMAANYVTW